MEAPALTPPDYLAALHAAGIPDGLPVLELDRQAARLLEIDDHTARRYRCGYTPIPGPVRVALRALSLNPPP